MNCKNYCLLVYNANCSNSLSVCAKNPLPSRSLVRTFAAAGTDLAYFSSVAKVVKAAAAQNGADREVA